MIINQNQFLDHLYRALRSVDEIRVLRSSAPEFVKKLLELIRLKVNLVDEQPIREDLIQYQIYMIVPRTLYNQLFVNNNPNNPPRTDLQPWQYQIAAVSWGSGRQNQDGTKHGTKQIFNLYLTRPLAVQMVQWLNNNPAVAAQLINSIALGGIDEFRQYLDNQPEWNFIIP